jgi:imidazolonepropionase-like amidohydrolase
VRISFKRISVLLVLLCATVFAQNETGKFRLHKFEQPIGEESYTITRQGDTFALESDFLFTDRGTKVPLKASLKIEPDYTPQTFSIKGNTSRHSIIDAEVTIRGDKAEIRDGKETHQTATPKRFFTIAGYAPVALQMTMMRYWREHGSPAKLASLPSGELEIKDRGSEKFTINGQHVALERYSVKGLAWGVQTLWMDGKNNLAALVTRDAEFDHFEAVREEYEPALAAFVSSAAKDEMAELEELGRSLPGRRTGAMAFTGATLIDGTGKPPIANATIVTSAGKIVAAGPAGSVKIPAGAARIDLKGKYVIPGLWDMHAHYEQVEWGPIYLAAGVTTVRDVGNEFEFISSVRDKVNSGHGLGPHMLNAGIVDGDSRMAIGIDRVNSPQDAENWVRKYHDAGFEQMKIYSSVTPENVKAICKDAHALGMTVTGHIPEGMNVFEGVKDGMDQVNHIQYLVAPLIPKDFDPRKATPEQRLQARADIDINSPAGKEMIKFLKDHGTVIDDTVALFEMFSRPEDVPESAEEPGVTHVPIELREQLTSGGVPPPLAPLAKQAFQKMLDIIGALHRAGVPVVAGTDQAVPGYSVYREIELYVQAGFTPMEALQAATIVPARVMKVDKETGTVETGKRADFAILDANPLDNIHNIRSVKSVVANGTLYDSAPLWRSVGFTP